MTLEANQEVIKLTHTLSCSVSNKKKEVGVECSLFTGQLRNGMRVHSGSDNDIIF